MTSSALPSAIAIILARGGSKGLPRKNALPIAGRPCIEWTIDHALAAETVGLVVVSTDDAELLAIGRAWSDRTDGRIHVHVRPSELASDTATIDAAARAALVAVSPSGRGTDPVVILYGNVPVRPAGLIDRAVQLLVDSRADSVQSYAPVGKFHPWWTARVDPDSGAVKPWEGDILNHGVFRRQDLPPAYVPDGGVIAVTREALMLELQAVKPGPHAFFGREDRRRGVLNPEGAVVDIDTRIDMMVAEALLTEPRPSGSGQSRTHANERPSGSLDRIQHLAEGAPGPAFPAAYLITFRTHGSWLHGDERGSTDRFANTPGQPVAPPDSDRERWMRERLKGEPVALAPDERALVERTIAEVCAHRGWKPLAVSARTNYVHCVVSAARDPEFVMNSFKSWCTRRLVESGSRQREDKLWVRHGSTRYLWDAESVGDAVDYTLNRQDSGGNTHG